MTQPLHPHRNPNPTASPSANARPNRPLVTTALLALALALPSAACRSLQPDLRIPRSTGLLASGPRPSEIVGASRQALPAVRGPARAPEHILRDPAERMRFMERMRVQILHRTLHVSPADYHRAVRSSLGAQLRTTGLLPDEVEVILTDVDRTRGL